MYNTKVIDELILTIKNNDGIGKKESLIQIIKDTFDLVADRNVYYCDEFAIRFSYSKKNSSSFSNTVLSLSQLQKYDTRPFFVCLVTPEANHLFLANSTMINKISHSSKDLRIDNIRGSFNGSDILRIVEEVLNEPSHFESLYAIHEGFSFEDNLQRLVANTTNIQPRGNKFYPTDKELDIIFHAPQRALEFTKSKDYMKLENDLRLRVENVKSEIAIAALIDNVNLRGRIIEYLITSNGDNLTDQLITSLQVGETIPAITTGNDLGDYKRVFPKYTTKTDVKTKVLFLSSNPKGYNIDKLLEFLTDTQSIYLIYIVAIDKNKQIKTKLCSLFNPKLLKGTRVFHHWAGRNSRGVTQYDGHSLSEIVNEEDYVDIQLGTAFLNKLLKT